MKLLNDVHKSNEYSPIVVIWAVESIVTVDNSEDTIIENTIVNTTDDTTTNVQTSPHEQSNSDIIIIVAIVAVIAIFVIEKIKRKK